MVEREPRDHSFSAFAKFSDKLTFLSPWYAHVRVRKGVRIVSFSESFVNKLNKWSPADRQRPGLTKINTSNEYIETKQSNRYITKAFAFVQLKKISRNKTHVSNKVYL